MVGSHPLFEGFAFEGSMFLKAFGFYCFSFHNVASRLQLNLSRQTNNFALAVEGLQPVPFLVSAASHIGIQFTSQFDLWRLCGEEEINKNYFVCLPIISYYLYLNSISQHAKYVFQNNVSPHCLLSNSWIIFCVLQCAE
jgi:hypothetical protein